MFSWWLLLACVFVALLEALGAFKRRTPFAYMRGLMSAPLLIWLIFFRP